MKLELFFDTSKYVKISNPSFSIGGDIVLRGKTIDGGNQAYCCIW